MKVSFRKLNEGEVVSGYNPKSKQHNVEFIPTKRKHQYYVVIIDNQILAVAYPDKVGYTIAQLYENEGWKTTSYKKCKTLEELQKELLK